MVWVFPLWDYLQRKIWCSFNNRLRRTAVDPETCSPVLERCRGEVSAQYALQYPPTIPHNTHNTPQYPPTIALEWGVGAPWTASSHHCTHLYLVTCLGQLWSRGLNTNCRWGRRLLLGMEIILANFQNRSIPSIFTLLHFASGGSPSWSHSGYEAHYAKMVQT